MFYNDDGDIGPNVFSEDEAKEFQPFFEYVQDSWDLVHAYFSDKDKARLWFVTPNPLLGNISPYTMILLGRGEKLVKFIENQLYQNRKDDET